MLKTIENAGTTRQVDNGKSYLVELMADDLFSLDVPDLRGAKAVLRSIGWAEGTIDLLAPEAARRAGIVD